MIKLGVHQALVVSSADIARECLVTNDKVFANRPQTIVVEHMGYNSAMFGFSPYGPYWREIRKITTIELLSNHRLEMMKHVRISEVRSAIKALHDTVSIDFRHWFSDISLNTTVRLIAGKSLKEFYPGVEYNRWKNALRDFFELGGAFVPADALPFFEVVGYGRV